MLTRPRGGRSVGEVVPSGEPAPALDIRELTVEFRTCGRAVRAVNGVSLAVHPGRVLAVLGESGSGKSMLLRTVIGIQPAGAQVSGEVWMRAPTFSG